MIDIGPSVRHRIVLLVVICVVIVLACFGVWRSSRGTDPVPGPTPGSAGATPRSTASPSSNRIDFDVNLSWLDPPADFDLYVRGGGAVFRIDAATGATVRVWIPELDSGPWINSPALMVPTVRGILIRPVSSSAVYVVPDHGTAGSFVSPRSDLLPGPDPGQVWVRQDDQHLVLVGLDGSPTSTTVEVPGDLSSAPQPDGHGYVVVESRGAVHDLRPGRSTRLATGRILASGPNRLLVGSCTRARCQAEVLGPDLQPLRTVELPKLLTLTGHGVVSADGRYAALGVADDPSDNPVTLVDLATGTSRRLPASISWEIVVPGSGQLALSPDGRWLFLIDPLNKLEAVDTTCTSGRCLHTLAELGNAQQVAVRPDL